MPFYHASDAEPNLHLPPSPPLSLKPATESLVERLLGVIRLRARDQPSGDEDWRVFTLSPAQFVELEGRIEADDELFGYFHDKVRYDYDPSDGEFVLRMPKPIHEDFNRLVEREIVDAIQRLASNWDDRHEQHAAKTLRDIFEGRSTTVELQPRPKNSNKSSSSSSEYISTRRSPDSSFFYPGYDLPALVIEVSYSEQTKMLERSAESYILGSAHRIRCVIGLDIAYPGKNKDKSAKLSIWRPGVEVVEDRGEVGICRCDVDALLFQTAEGDACDGDMELTVADILPRIVLNTLSTSLHVETITIPVVRLRELLHQSGIGSVSEPLPEEAPTDFLWRRLS